MTTTTITPEISAFAAAVREALADLPADEREDLTDGLEADLAEAYAEDLRRELPDPVEYATELRTAAGLPERTDARRRGLADAWRSTQRDLAALVHRNPVLGSVAEFFSSIRPVWWVLRAWVAAWGVGVVLGYEGGFLPRIWVTWLVLAAFVVVSVQWGRGRWTFRGLAPAVVIGNVIAAVLLVPVVAMASDWSTQVDYSYVDGGPGDLTGVYLDGSPVTNIFPYDAAGKPLTDVQLFDENGNPLRATVEGADGCIDADCFQYGTWAARVLTSGLVARNVYPMAMTPNEEYDDTGERLPAAGEAVQRPLPFPTAPGVVVPQETTKVAPDND